MITESQRFQQALSRLEAAIERVETAMPATTMPANMPHDGRFAALEARHRTLRDGTTKALARLDRLIGEQG